LKYTKIILIILIVCMCVLPVQAVNTFVTIPRPLTGLGITGNSDTTCNISWAASPDADYYEVWSSPSAYHTANATGTFHGQTTGLTYELTGLTAVTTYITVFPIGVDGAYTSCGAAVNILRSYEGFEGFTKIYWNTAQEDANNPYLEDAAEELQTYLGLMGLALNITNVLPAAPAVYFSVNSTHATLAGMGDEAFELLSDEDGLTITGTTALACRHGAYYLLDNVLGVKWLSKSTAWTIVPGALASIDSLNIVSEPDYLWRQIQWAGYYTGLTDLKDWGKHNRMWGAKKYDVGHSYSYIYNLTVGNYAANPTYFLPSDIGGVDWPWQLDPTQAGVIALAKTYANTRLSAAAAAVLYGADTIPRAVAVISPNDGGGFDPPLAAAQNVTDAVWGLVKEVAANITSSYPNGYAGAYCYAQYSNIPTDNLSSNVLAVIATDYNYSDPALTTDEQIAGYIAKGASVGIRDYMWPLSDSFDIKTDIIGNVKYYQGLGAITYQMEGIDSWASRNLSYWVISRLLWDSSLDVDTLITEFLVSAFGSASSVMADYYDITGTLDFDYADRFTLLSQAETLESGDSAILARLRQLELFNYYRWQKGQMSTLSNSDLESLYTLTTQLRDLYLLDYTTDEAAVRAALIARGYSTAQVNALINYTPPTDEDAAAYLAEALAYFSTHFSAVVIASADDGSTQVGGASSYTGTSIYLSSTGNARHGYFGFPVDIAQGANITSAKMDLCSFNDTNNSTSLVIYGIYEDNTDNLSVDNGELRPVTTANVTWNPTVWGVNTWYGKTNDPQELKTIVQELINRPGWVSGNRLMFKIVNLTNTGIKRVYSYDGGFVPRLYIEYSTD
jgi:hypothetical protein